MITAIRLRERNKQKNFLARTYTMGSGTKFTAGENGIPSQVRIVTDQRDIDEARSVEQFEVIEAHSDAALGSMLRREMEDRARRGGIPVQAEVQSPSVSPNLPRPPAVVRALVTPTTIGDEQDDFIDDETYQELTAPSPSPVPSILTPGPVPAQPSKGAESPARAVTEVDAPDVSQSKGSGPFGKNGSKRKGRKPQGQ